MNPTFTTSLRRMAFGISLTACLAAAQTSPLQVDPPSLSYSFNPADAPADRTVVVTNTGTAKVVSSLFTSQTGQPSAAASFVAEAAPPADPARIYSSQAMAADFSTDRVIVVFKDGLDDFASAPAANAVSASGGRRELALARFPGKAGKRAHRGKRVMLSRLRKHSRQAVLEAIQAIRQDPNVAYVQPDYLLHANEVPNDPDFNKQYHLENSGQTGGTAGADIKATTGWNKQKSAKKVLIGLIDSGIDYLHPDLEANIWTNPGEIAGNGIDDDNNGFIDDVHGWDFVSDDADPMDDNLHGTHCAGILAAEGNNSVGVSGVAWQAQLMALKFLNESGTGTTSAAINAINYAKAMGAKITSNSWGGGPYDQALIDAIAGSGALFVAAAGNNGQDVDAFPQYPAGYILDNIISVASTDAYDALSSFSNYGYNNVDVAAPGTAIYSTTPRAQTLAMQNNNISAMYGTLSGTSMATPIVSGMAALILERNGSLTAMEVKNIIMGSVDVLPALAGFCRTGGRVNLDRALANTSASWLGVNPATLTVGPGQSQTLTVRANPAGLAAGTWQGQVTLRAPGIPDKDIPVSMNISACVSIQGPASVDFGNAWAGYASTRYMRLTNACNSDLNVSGVNSSHGAFSAATAFPLRIGPFSSKDVPVRLLSASAGTFDAILSVASNAQNSPTLNIPVSGSVLAPPRLDMNPTTLTGSAMAGAETDVSLSIANRGSSDLTVDFSATTLDNVAWITAHPSSVTVAPGSIANIRVHLDATALLGGIHPGTLLLTHNDPGGPNPFKVPVTFTVIGARRLAANPSSLTLGMQTTDRNAPFTMRAINSTFPLYSNARVADMDNDGDPDLVVCNENYSGNKPTILWLENRNSHLGRWIPHTVIEKNVAGNYFYEDLQPVDLDKDGDMDVAAVVAVPYNAGSVVWFEKTALGFEEHLISANLKYGASVKAADFDRDGDIDLVTASGTDNKVAIFENDGHQSFSERILSNTADNVFEVDAGDVDGDGDLDVVSASYNDGKFAWYQNNGAAGYAEHFIATVEGAQHAVFCDLDKDGDKDIVYSSLTGGAGWFENDGHGNYAVHPLFQATSEIWFYTVRVADMDNDGDLDLILGNRNGLDYYVTWYENDGNRNFSTAHVVMSHMDRGFTVADYDGDGDMDIAGGLAVSPASLPAPALYFCESSIATNAGFVQLSNQGTAPTSVSPLLMSSDRFKTSVQLPLVVPPQETVSVAVTYGPGSGPSTGTLTIISNATDNPSLTVILNGSDTDPSILLPGRIQAEEYKVGGEGVGYHDLTAGNTGGQHRTDGVDIEATTDAGGGYNVGWIDAGEWLAYRVNVANTGLYTLTARLASNNAGTKTATVTVDGATVATFNFTDASGWQSWKDVIVANVNLSAGQHELRINMGVGGFNLNYLDVAAKPNAAPVANAGADRSVTTNTLVTLDGRGSSDPDNGPQALSYAWTQLSGPAVTLANANSSQPSFTSTFSGGYEFRLTVSDGLASSSDDISIIANPPRFGIALPGRIQAEDYKNGGEGVGYHDLTAGNTGGAFRADNVDIEATTDAGGGYNVGWIDAGDWLAYDVNVTQPGLYTLTARMASNNGGAKAATVTIDGATVTTFTFTDASGWQSWKDVIITNLNLPLGFHELRITMNTGGFNLNYLDVATQVQNGNADLAGLALSAGPLSPAFAAGTTAYAIPVANGVTSTTVTPTVAAGTSTVKVNGTPVASGSASASLPLNVGANTFTIAVTAQNATVKTYTVTVNRDATQPGIPVPGRIQFEDYKAGGEGVGYHDLTAGNSGGAYRTDNVDIEATTDAGGGYNVGWTDGGEWLAYDVNVTSAGAYNFTARLASQAGGTKTAVLTVDGATVATFNFTDASGWQSWKDLTVAGVNLTAGNHVFRLTLSTGGLNLNYLDVQKQAISPELINNGDFSNGLVGWQTYFGAAGLATITNEANSARVSITAQGANPWDIQIFQPMALTAGKVYTLEFDMKAESTPKTFRAVVEHNGDPWTKYQDVGYTITAAANNYQHYTLVWTQPTTDAGGRIVLDFGFSNAFDYWVDNVSLK